jgi:signal transduction histidine kinase
MFLAQAWNVLRAPYASLSFRDSAGTLIHELGLGWASGRSEEETVGEEGELFTVLEPVRDPDSGLDYGSIEAALRLGSLIPDEALAASFGASGYSVILDRASGRVLRHPSRTYLTQSVAQIAGPTGWNLSPTLLASPSGSFEFTDEGGRHVASFASLTDPAWTVVSTGAVDEFAAPFARTRVVDLGLVSLLAVTVWVGFLLVTDRVMSSLTALTRAADQVSRGDLSPSLPAPGTGEVGRLTRAFALMLEQIREMLRRIRESGHMVAVGRFASQLSHEIRNPLTAVKLNLQSLQRGVDSGEIDETFAEPVTISLDEVRRLEAVVSGVLSLARGSPASQAPHSVHASVEGALQLLQPQLAAGGVVVEINLRATEDIVIGDGMRLQGAFLNLFLNAVEAMPEGGRLEVSTDLVDAPPDRKGILVRIADEGPGVPVELRESIFDAFFSTKEGGTGFGLALAQKTVEEHDGRLMLEDDHDHRPGAVFTVELPLSGPSRPAEREPSPGRKSAGA